MPCRGCGQNRGASQSAPAAVAKPLEASSESNESKIGSRTSCLECVMKHLGQAWVLYSEYKVGYPYKLLIIGHLAEAEAESESWPALHNLIREQRKRFQDSEQLPDLDFLGLKVLETEQFLFD